MPRIDPIPYEKATGRAKELLDQVKAEWGMTPKCAETLAHSPAALEAYVSGAQALGRGKLSVALREQIAIAVAEATDSKYCLAAHCAFGKSVGLSDEVIADSRRCTSTDSNVQALLRFVREIVDKRGFVGEDEVQRLHNAGYGDEEIVEIIANVGMNLFTSYFDHITGTELDFPAVEELKPA